MLHFKICALILHKKWKHVLNMLTVGTVRRTMSTSMTMRMTTAVVAVAAAMGTVEKEIPARHAEAQPMWCRLVNVTCALFKSSDPYLNMFYMKFDQIKCSNAFWAREQTQSTMPIEKSSGTPGTNIQLRVTVCWCASTSELSTKIILIARHCSEPIKAN